MDYTITACCYAADIITGEIPAGKYVKQAASRFEADLERNELDLDRDHIHRWCRNLERLPHVKGGWAAKRQTLKLAPWQVFIIANIFGWFWLDGRRRFTEVYLEIPRKNGKSFLAAGIGIGCFTWDADASAECLAGATTEEQAGYVWTPAKQIFRKLPEFAKQFSVEVNAKSLVRLDDLSRFIPIIGDPGDGSNPSLAIVDELHEHKDDRLLSTMVTGMGARGMEGGKQPLLLQITTAGSDMGGPCYEKRADSIKILSGAEPDDAIFSIIYGIDEDDNWDTVAAQVKANPNYGISVSPDFLEGQLKQARRSPSRQAAYKTKHLNMWVGAKAAWMNMLAYQACKSDIKLEDMRGEPCIVGIDLASKTDIASMAMLFPPGKSPKWRAFVKHYLPEDTILERDRYQGWHAGGWLTSTPGNVTDFEYIAEDLRALKSEYEVREVPFDPFQATQFSIQMLEEGFPMIEVGATVKNFSEPMKQLEALILERKIEFSRDPVLQWMFSCVTAKLDLKDNIYPNRGDGLHDRKSKIDGVVALIMALNRWMVHEEEQPSIYETRGIIGL